MGLARRKELIEDHAQQLKSAKGELHAMKVDMTKEDEIIKAFHWVKDNLGPIQVLINNAGTTDFTTLVDGDSSKWRNMIELNLFSVCVATREAIRSMRDEGVDGHIVNINSIAGHYVPNIKEFSVYPATKHGVTALTETLRKELIELGSRIKVTVSLHCAISTN